MRTLVSIAVATFALGLALGSCGKELSADYCAANPHDTDCLNAGLTVVDAPTPCTMDEQCAGMNGNNVCDVPRQQCVQCTLADQPACTSMGQYCADDDRCHQCLVDANCSDGVCLPDLTCAASGSILYAAPNGTGNCTSAIAACMLATAIGKLDAAHGVILLAPGDYAEGPHVIAKPAVLIGKGASDDPTLTNLTNAAGQHGPVITVQGGVPVTLDYLTVHGSDTDGVACSGATLTFFHSNSYGNTNFGVSAAACTLDVEQAQIHDNTAAAMLVTDTAITVLNNFMYGNGTATEQGGGAVRLRGSTNGEFAYNSIAYNTYKSNQHPGLTCATTGATKVEFNIIAGNIGKSGQLDPPSATCTVSPVNFINDAADGVHFKMATPPYDLHLSSTTPAGAAALRAGGPPPIVDNPDTTCTSYDIDGDTRPINGHCDLGADEYHP